MCPEILLERSSVFKHWQAIWYNVIKNQEYSSLKKLVWFVDKRILALQKTTFMPIFN